MAKTILQAVTGSHAYGLNHATSDTDKMYIFVAPTVEVAGLHWASKHESFSDAGPTGDDTTGHEIGKYLRLVLKSNPTLIELLFMNDYEVLDETGQGLVALRDKILYTEGVRNAYYGYAKAQIERVKREYPNHKPKMARHAIRITYQGLELLTTGTTNVKVTNPDWYFQFNELPFENQSNIMDNWLANLNEAKSVLPDKPDVRAVAEFLKDVRRSYIE
jgi:predicted nucleotidyltransferase